MAKTEQLMRRAIALGEASMIVLDQTGVPIARGFKLSPNGLDISGRPSFAQWEHVGGALRTIERGIQFAIGDYLNYGEERFGEEAAQAIDAETGWSLKTIAVYRWVASRVAKERRRMDKLTIRHHLAVAALGADKQVSWLNRAAEAADESWTVQRLSNEMRLSEDANPLVYWVLVMAESEQDQVELQARLEQQGRITKALVKRSGK